MLQQQSNTVKQHGEKRHRHCRLARLEGRRLPTLVGGVKLCAVDEPQPGDDGGNAQPLDKASQSLLVVISGPGNMYPLGFCHWLQTSDAKDPLMGSGPMLVHEMLPAPVVCYGNKCRRTTNIIPSRLWEEFLRLAFVYGAMDCRIWRVCMYI